MDRAHYIGPWAQARAPGSENVRRARAAAIFLAASSVLTNRIERCSSVMSVNTLQAHWQHRRRKLALSHGAAAAWHHSTLGKAWRCWRQGLQHAASKREVAARAVAAWRNVLVAGCWRQWAGRAAHERLLTQRAAAFIREAFVSVYIILSRGKPPMFLVEDCRREWAGRRAQALPDKQ